MVKKIIIADDHPIVRTGTKLILQSNYKELTIDQASNYTHLINQLHKNEYDLVLLDINMPGSIKRMMITEIKEIQKDIKIMVYTAYDQDIAMQYISNGADGYLNKSSSEKNIINSIKHIFEFGYFYPSEIVKKLAENPNLIEKLSKREVQIFKLMAEGYGNLEIMNQLKLQSSTVSTHKKRIFEKLNIDNISDLIKVYEKLH
ncbi:response regulator transcription factor [Chryseobacterium sp. BIGb0232]|uniref:response regulator transcription factor n=1 Tax=Chryseobacterium sp. BIGb0232 TaxID=2940598 RepID=UPI000F4991EE|nr:response regulator transcription factor [Chryseobacterium sp. BIGb0232]MCS4300936.1 DNA-binding NarL/FixJ family response regulator [Chryseobacterium sp. BIGb0232]ROS20196.1 LuxR family two component transcriptional regulator [Chryseobacterium nakagawai]